VSTTLAHVSLRPPAARVGLAVVLLAALVPLFAAVPLSGEEGWALRMIVCGLAAGFAWQQIRLAATGGSDGHLVVRNYWGNRTIHRDEVDRVVIDRALRSDFWTMHTADWWSAHRPGFWSVQLELLDGSVVPLDVTEAPFRPLFGASLERKAQAVRDWVDGRPQAFL
jgi:hypothetical protein